MSTAGLVPWVRRRLRYVLDMRWMNDPTVRKVILAVAVAFLLGGIAISLRQHPDVFSSLRWRPALLLVAIGVPLTLFLNAIEFILTGRLVGVTVSFVKALEVTIIGTAANMLPLPGGTLVRVAGLKAAGASYRRGTAGTLLVALVWIGIAFLYAGAWMGTIHFGWTSLGFMGLGVVVLVGAVAWAGRLKSSFQSVLFVMTTKSALVVLDSARIYLCFSALGADATFAQASSLAVAGVLGTAVSFVPAGLGVREGVAAALSPLVGLAAGLSFLATFLNRMLGLLTIVPLSAALIVKRDKHTEVV